MSILTFRQCIKGANNLLGKCLNVRSGEKILVVLPPYAATSDMLVSAGSLWWAATICSSEGPGCQHALDQLIKDRLDVQHALSAAAEDFGAVVTPFSINAMAKLNSKFVWKNTDEAKKLVKFLKQWDVIIDLTLRGLDEMPPTKKSRDGYNNLREEILDGSEVRGTDIHVASRTSFVDGAMCADYSSLSQEIEQFKAELEKTDFLTIKDAKGTNLRLDIERTSVSSGTGLIHKPGEWHFLPSGVVFATIKTGGGNIGKVVLDGPMYGVGSLEGYPLSLELTPGTGTIDKIHRSENTPTFVQNLLEKMFSIPESRYIGEVVIGFNPKGNPKSSDPMEFYVAKGSVTIAIGRNDHMGGNVRPTTPLSPSLHAHALIKNPTVVLQNNMIVLEKGKFVQKRVRK